MAANPADIMWGFYSEADKARMRRHDVISQRAQKAREKGLKWSDFGFRDNMWEGQFAEQIQKENVGAIQDRLNTFSDSDLQRAEQALTLWEGENKQVEETKAADDAAEKKRQEAASQAAMLRMSLLRSQFGSRQNGAGPGPSGFGLSNALLGGGIASRALVGR